MTKQPDGRYLIDGKLYTSVTQITELIRNMDGGGMHAGAAVSAEAVHQLFLNGEYPPSFLTFCENLDYSHSLDSLCVWLADDSGKKWLRGSVKVYECAARDRGTLIDCLFTAALQGQVPTWDYALQFIEAEMQSKAAESQLSWREWKAAVEAGDEQLIALLKGKQERPYLCTLAEVSPYAESLLSWMNAHRLEPTSTQTVVWSESIGVAGTFDYEGSLDGEEDLLLDLKTAKDASLAYAAQVFAYGELRETPPKGRGLILCQPEKTCVRMLKDTEKAKAAWWGAYALYSQKSVKGLFAGQSHVEKLQVAA